MYVHPNKKVKNKLKYIQCLSFMNVIRLFGEVGFFLLNAMSFYIFTSHTVAV